MKTDETTEEFWTHWVLQKEEENRLRKAVGLDALNYYKPKPEAFPENGQHFHWGFVTLRIFCEVKKIASRSDG